MPRRIPPVRFLHLESLECRQLCAGLAAGLESPELSSDAPEAITLHPWQNPASPLKVTGASGLAVPLDALIVINELNNRQISDPVTGRLPEPSGPSGPPPYYDVNGDGFVTAIDALQIFNDLNNRSHALADGEGPSAFSAAAGDTIFAEPDQTADPLAALVITPSAPHEERLASSALVVERNEPVPVVSTTPGIDRISDDLLQLLATDCAGHRSDVCKGVHVDLDEP